MLLYLSWMSLQTQCLGYPLFNKCTRSGCNSWLSFITVIFQSHLEASWLPSCTKILLTTRTQPTAIALNYSINNIRNNIRQITIYENISLVWDSLTLTPINRVKAWNCSLAIQASTTTFMMAMEPWVLWCGTCKLLTYHHLYNRWSEQ